MPLFCFLVETLQGPGPSTYREQHVAGRGGAMCMFGVCGSDSQGHGTCGEVVTSGPNDRASTAVQS